MGVSPEEGGRDGGAPAVDVGEERKQRRRGGRAKERKKY